MAIDTALVPATDAALAAEVVVKGDLKHLTEVQRLDYVAAVCRSLGLNPLTRPFEFITLNGKLTLYATRTATDQLRSLRGVTITSLEPQQIGDIYVVVATGRDRTGREDSSTGAVPIKGVQGEALANAMMKAETKAKRRLTLSLAGLGWVDESEVDSIPGAQREPVEPPKSLAERAAARAAEIFETPAEPVKEEPPAPVGLTDEERREFKRSELRRAQELSGEFAGMVPAPAGLTKRQFVEALAEHKVDPKYATSVRVEMFPDVKAELSDSERRLLLDALLVDVTPEADSTPLFTEGEWAPAETTPA